MENKIKEFEKKIRKKIKEAEKNKYTKFRNTNNMFTIKGRTILRFKTLKENNIKDGDKVLLNNDIL